MRGSSAAAAVVLAIAACGSSSAAVHTSSTDGTAAHTTAGPATCGPRASRTVIANPHARVYVLGERVYGCAGAGGRSHELGGATNCLRSARANPISLAGSVVAYGLQVCGIDTGSTQVVVERLTDGRQLHTLAATSSPQAPESYQDVTSLVLRSDGAVAWIGVAHSIVRRTGEIEVHRADRRGEAELDSGSAVDPGSLGLHGSEVTWRHGGATRSANLL
jgi:hypothetical protein